jgi:ABC-2 type transport system permease protein
MMSAPATPLPPRAAAGADTRGSAILRSFFTGAWLGWQIESNWTDPFLFAVYSLVKPLASAGILVVMYGVITGGDYQAPAFPYMYFGNAFYIYVGAVMVGISWAVIDDRELYKTLKYMYIAPIRIPAYWIGRGVARFLTASMAVVITIACGALFLRVPLDLPHVDWPLFAASLVLGIAALCMLGLILASVTLLLAHHFFLMGEAVAGALFLLSGAIFPLEILPAWLQPVGFALPITYWLELMRRSLGSGVAGAFPTFSAYGDLHLFGMLLGLSLLYAGIAFVAYRLCDRQARERGLIDLVTNY